MLDQPSRHRHANLNWVWSSSTQLCTQDAILAMLQDIREELRAINRRLNCQSTLEIPVLLRRMESNTRKPKRKRK